MTLDHTYHREFADIRSAAVAGIADKDLAPCPSLAGKHDQDLRDTAVTWLARAGATLLEITAITGHNLASIHNIMKHYLAITPDSATPHCQAGHLDGTAGNEGRVSAVRSFFVAMISSLLVAGCSDEADDDFRASEHERLEALCADLDRLSQDTKVEAERQRIDDIRLANCPS
jgi:outer membrane murein-binding lipoprotein Lpp